MYSKTLYENKIIIIIKITAPFRSISNSDGKQEKWVLLLFKIIIMAVSLLLVRSHRGRLGERSMGDHEA